MKFMLPLAAVMSMAAAPAMAAPELQRQEASVEDSSQFAPGGILIALLALTAAIAGVVIVSQGGSDSPNSP